MLPCKALKNVVGRPLSYMLMEDPPTLMSLASVTSGSQWSPGIPAQDYTVRLLQQPQNPAWLEEDLHLLRVSLAPDSLVCTWGFLCWVFPEALCSLYLFISFHSPYPTPSLCLCPSHEDMNVQEEYLGTLRQAMDSGQKINPKLEGKCILL